MTKKRLAANRRNALKSTGPKTLEGKAVASMIALKYGLRSSSLAVPWWDGFSLRLSAVQTARA